MPTHLLDSLRVEIYQLERRLETLWAATPREEEQVLEMRATHCLLTQLKEKLAIIDRAS